MGCFKKLTAAFVFIVAALLLSTGAAAENIVDPYRLYTYGQMVQDISALEEEFPELISSCTLGQTVEGRDIPCFSLGKGKREIIICASLHAREFVSTNFVMYMAEGYAKGYEGGDEYNGMSYRELLDEVKLIIVPMINADGVALAQLGTEYSGYDLVKDMKIADSDPSGVYAWKANINGVDLNRNYPYNWGLDSKALVPASADYSGSYAASEPETRAMLGLVDNSPFYLLCSFHTSGEYVYWIDNSNSGELYNSLRPIAKRIAGGIGYKLCGVEDVSDFGGYLVNYARGAYEKPCITVELCPLFGVYPYTSYDKLQKTIEKVYPIGLLIAKEAVALPLAETAIDVTINGKLLLFPDVRPAIENGRTLVPVRAVAEACGIEVIWDSKAQTVSLIKGETEVTMTVGCTGFMINGEAVPSDCAPQISGGRTLVPIRGILEALGYTVEWDAAARTIAVSE